MVLAAIILQDVFLDPEIVYKYLKVQQLDACFWLLEFLMLSVDGVETHPADIAKIISCHKVTTRAELISCLRYRYDRDQPPPRLELWIKLLGGWPALTAGGCR